MRHETCLLCLNPQILDNPQLIDVIFLTEVLSPNMHHHHVMEHVSGCHKWWISDMVIGGFGLPYNKKRDTEVCSCPDIGTGWNEGIVIIPLPENKCKCTQAEINEHKFKIGPK